MHPVPQPFADQPCRVLPGAPIAPEKVFAIAIRSSSSSLVMGPHHALPDEEVLFALISCRFPLPGRNRSLIRPERTTILSQDGRKQDGCLRGLVDQTPALPVMRTAMTKRHIVNRWNESHKEPIDENAVLLFQSMSDSHLVSGLPDFCRVLAPCGGCGIMGRHEP